MKKRNLLLALVMSFVMLLSACGNNQSLEGKWVGTLDLTDHIVKVMATENASIEKYAKFEALTFDFVFEFTKDTVSIKVDEASTQKFIENAEVGVANMIDAMAADLATENNVTIEDIFAGMNVTRDEFVQATIQSMNLNAMVAEMTKALELSGSYAVDEDVIVVFYEDNTYEEMKYELTNEGMKITVSDGTNEFSIDCKKAK